MTNFDNFRTKLTRIPEMNFLLDFANWATPLWQQGQRMQLMQMSSGKSLKCLLLPVLIIPYS